MSAAQEMVTAVRAYFHDFNMVKNSLHKVYFHQKEADKISDRLKRRVCTSAPDLSRKIHLRYFALHIENISDYAEDVANRLTIQHHQAEKLNPGPSMIYLYLLQRPVPGLVARRQRRRQRLRHRRGHRHGAFHQGGHRVQRLRHPWRRDQWRRRAATLERLGEINALAGSFAAALAAALTVYWMTVAGLPVSTSQAIVGAIIGWNWFTESVTDAAALTKILATWVICPLLAGLVAALLFKVTAFAIGKARLHLLRLDAYTRLALILAGAFGAYSLGANNIANVMGVFVPVSPFTEFKAYDLFTVTSVQQLFLLGGIAIAVGVFTYSKKVMRPWARSWYCHRCRRGLSSSPPRAVPVRVRRVGALLATAGLPTIPLVPVSSSQAVVGAVLGIGLLRGGPEYPLEGPGPHRARLGGDADPGCPDLLFALFPAERLQPGSLSPGRRFGDNTGGRPSRR